MKIIRFLFFIIVVLFVIGIFYWASFAPPEDISQRIQRTLKEQEKRADLSFKDVVFEEVVGGVKYWQLQAATAMVNKSTGIATLQNSNGTFFKNGKGVLRFTSPAAVWKMNQKEIYLDQPLGYDIKLESRIAALVNLLRLKDKNLSLFSLPQKYQEAGYWFRANNLSWKLTTQKLLCQGGILLNKGEITGYAEKLESDVGLEKVTLEGNPKILIAPTKSAPVTIEAQIFEVISPQDLILAKGAPKIFWQEATINSESAQYRQKEKKLELTAPQIRYQNIRAGSERADYLVEEQKIILEGKAQAVQGKDKLSGDKVIVSLKDQKISLLGKGKIVITEDLPAGRQGEELKK